MATKELTNSEVVNSLNALQRLVTTQDKLPIRLSVAAHDNIKTLQNQVVELENFRQDILDDYAEFDEDGEIKTVEGDDGEQTDEIQFKSEDARESYIDDINNKYNSTVELDLQTLSIDLVDRVDVAPPIVFALEWMFDSE